MREMMRVLGKKRLLLLMFLLFLNAFIIVKDNYADRKTSMAFNEMILLTNEYKAETLTCREAAVKAWRQYFQEYSIDSSEETAEALAVKEARELLMNLAGNVDEHQDAAEKLREDALALMKSGFYQEKSFEYLNLQKTRHDLAVYVDTEMSISNGIWLEKLFHYEYLQIFVLIMAVSIIYQYMEGQKNGLYHIIHAAPNGRGRLFMCRFLIIGGAITMITCLFYVETGALLLMIHGGAEGIFERAVSKELSVLTVGMLSRAEFVCLLILVSSIAAVAISLLLWYVLSLFRNVNIGMTVFSAFAAMDYLLHFLVSSKSILRGLHFVNIYYLIYPNKSVSYYNWGYSFGITSLIGSTVALAAALSLILGLLNYNATVRSCRDGKENILEQWLCRISEGFMRLLGKFPVVFMEMYKVLFSQKISIVLLFLFYVVTRMDVGAGVIYDAAGSYLSGYYERANGLSYGPELESIYEEYLAEYQMFLENTKRNMETAEEVIQYRKSLLQEIRDNLDYLKQMKEKGYTVMVTNPFEYWGALGPCEGDNQRMLALINVIAAIAVSSGFLSYEKKNNMLKMVRAYRNRCGWTVKKIMCNMSMIASFEIATYGIYYYRLFQSYQMMESISAPLKSLPVFQNYPFNLSIGGFLILDAGIRFFLLLLLSMFVCYLSIYVDYIYCFLAGMTVIIPQLLYLIGFEMMDEWSVGKYVAFLPAFWEGAEGVRDYCIFFAFVCVTGSIMLFGMISRLERSRQ